MPSLVPPRDRCHQVGLLPKHLIHLNCVDIYLVVYGTRCMLSQYLLCRHLMHLNYVDICGYLRIYAVHTMWILAPFGFCRWICGFMVLSRWICGLPPGSRTCPSPLHNSTSSSALLPPSPRCTFFFFGISILMSKPLYHPGSHSVCTTALFWDIDYDRRVKNWSQLSHLYDHFPWSHEEETQIYPCLAGFRVWFLFYDLNKILLTR